MGEEEAGEGPDSARACRPHSRTWTLSQGLRGLHLHFKKITLAAEWAVDFRAAAVELGRPVGRPAVRRWHLGRR